jgi:hypothetical protein
MLALKYLLITCGVGMMIAAVCMLTYDLYREMLYRRTLEAPGGAVTAAPVVVRWRTSLALAMLAWGPLLVAFSIVVVPSGTAGVRVSEMSGTVPGTLYPGVHMVMPLVEDVSLFDTRDQIFTTGVSEDGKTERWDWRLRCDTGWMRRGWIISRGIYRVRWKRKSYRLPWLAFGGRSCRTTRCGMFFPRSGRKCGSGRRG